MTNPAFRSAARFVTRFALAAIVVALLLSCSGDNNEGRGNRPTGDRGDTATQNNGGSSDVEHRPFRPLTGDQPGGPSHTRPIPAEPSTDELQAAAQSSPTRLSAETFAILLNHAIEDQTAGSQGDAAVNDFGTLPPSALASIEELRNFPDNRAVPGGESYIRSRLTTTASGTEATVYVVEKIKSPKSLLNPEVPFVFWTQSILTLRWTGEQWEFLDYQSAGASEYEEFSEFTWRDTMDSGRDWRRFNVG